jgi:hypothetical protein
MLPTNALVTVADVRGEGVTPAISTARIERAIGYVSTLFESYTGRQFGYIEFTEVEPERHEGSGGLRLYLRRRPIVEVVSVRMGTVGTGAEVTDYVRTSEGDRLGYLYREGTWPLTAGRFPDLTHDPRLHPQAEYIFVSYSGGYDLPGQPSPPGYEGGAPVPLDLEFACLREVVRLLQGSGATPGLVSEATPGGWNQTWAQPKDGGGPLMPETLQVLAPYRTAESVMR